MHHLMLTLSRTSDTDVPAEVIERATSLHAAITEAA